MWYETADEMTVRYLLGELTESEQDRFEEQYLTDAAVHEQLLAIECELIDAFVRGDLSEEERRHFESGFLTTSERRKRVSLAQTLASWLGAPIQAQQRSSRMDVDNLEPRAKLLSMPKTMSRRTTVRLMLWPSSALARVAIAASLLLVSGLFVRLAYRGGVLAHTPHRVRYFVPVVPL